MKTRPASPEDAADIAAIYNQGIEDRSATFETSPRSAEEVATWLVGGYPVMVVEADSVVAFAACSSYSSRPCYRGIAEFAVYVRRDARGRGYGEAAMQALTERARAEGFWKLTSKVFTDNAASRRLLASLGFREVGILERHAKLDGVWRDVVLVEKLLSVEQLRG